MNISFGWIKVEWKHRYVKYNEAGAKLKWWMMQRSVKFEMFFWCLQIVQNTNKIFVRISALGSKKRSNQKNKNSVYHYVLFKKSEIYTTFFYLTSFKRLGQKFLQKFCWCFGRFENTKKTFWNKLAFKKRGKNLFLIMNSKTYFLWFTLKWILSLVNHLISSAWNFSFHFVSYFWDVIISHLSMRPIQNSVTVVIRYLRPEFKFPAKIDLAFSQLI